MASSTEPPNQSLSETFLATSRTLAYSLVWGGWMLFILGWWLGVKHEDLSRLVVFSFWILAAVSFACGIWHLLSLGRPAATPEDKQAQLLRQRKVLSVGLVAGGLVLIGFGFYLAISFRLSAFGEVVGMCLVGVSAVVCGWNLFKCSAKDADSQPFLDLLRRLHGPIGMSMSGAGLLLVVAALGLILILEAGRDWLPETAGLFFFGILGVAGGVRLAAIPTEVWTGAKMRAYVLVIGGVAGLILALGALVRAYLWRDDVFGGMRAWQGDRGWHLWLCAYVELIGLALMFASLLLARTDIRTSAVLRRTLYGYNAFLTGLLLLALLVVLNIVLFALFPGSFEWSKSRGAHTLSPSSKNMLNNLREPTTIYVLIPREQLTPELKNFLDNCQNQTAKLEVKYLNPNKDFDEYENLAKRFPDSLSGRVSRVGAVERGILIVYGSLPADSAKKVPHAFVPVSRLVESQPLNTKEEGVKGVLIFKGESEVVNELSFLAQDRKKRKVYFLQGDGELDINERERKVRRDLRVYLEPLGCGLLVDALKKEQYDVQGLTFAQQLPKDKTANLTYAPEVGPEKRKEVPDDAETVLIAGPALPMGAPILEALERYMDRGGKLLVYLDVVVDAKNDTLKTTDLEDFLRKYGVLAGKDFAMRVPRPGDPREVFATVPPDTANELAKNFVGEPVVLSTVRIVRPEPSAQKYKVEVLLQLDPRDRTIPSQQLYWEETAVQALVSPEKYVIDLARQGVLRVSSEPISVAVAVSDKLLDPGSGKESLKPRLVVFGDAEMISNAGLTEGELNFALTAAALDWLSAKKTGMAGPRPREAMSYTINPQKVNVLRMSYLPGWLMMLTILSLGAGIWVVRRR